MRPNVEVSRSFQTSSLYQNSGKFKKMKQMPDSFFQRKSKDEEPNQHFMFNSAFLDQSVEKLISSKGSRYQFLKKERQSLKEDKEGERENVTRDWNHISETVQDLGIPEMADVIGGQMFAGGHLRHTTTCCLAMRLADNIFHLTDEELQLALRDVSGWPADASNSEVLICLFKKVDEECSKRCKGWPVNETMQLATIWSRGPFRPRKPSDKTFHRIAILQTAEELTSLSMEDLMRFLLLCCYESSTASEVSLSPESQQHIEEQLCEGFFSLSESEVALGYTALSIPLRHKSPRLKQLIESNYGFRL